MAQPTQTANCIFVLTTVPEQRAANQWIMSIQLVFHIQQHVLHEVHLWLDGIEAMLIFETPFGQ